MADVGAVGPVDSAAGPATSPPFVAEVEAEAEAPAVIEPGAGPDGY